MPFKKKTPSPSLERKKEEALFSAIAHFEFVAGASRDVPHMEGFLPFYIKNMPLAQREMMVRYGTAKEKARTAICAEFEKHGSGPTQTPAPQQ